MEHLAKDISKLQAEGEPYSQTRRPKSSGSTQWTKFERLEILKTLTKIGLPRTVFNDDTVDFERIREYSNLSRMSLHAIQECVEGFVLEAQKVLSNDRNAEGNGKDSEVDDGTDDATKDENESLELPVYTRLMNPTIAQRVKERVDMFDVIYTAMCGNNEVSDDILDESIYREHPFNSKGLLPPQWENMHMDRPFLDGKQDLTTSA